MNKINEILDYGLLAELAYLKLENEWFKENNKYLSESIGDISLAEQGSIHNKNHIVNFLTGKNIKNRTRINIDTGKDYIPEELSDLTQIAPDRVDTILSLLERYTILEFTSDDGFLNSDFQAMLLQNISTKQYTIAFRGTAGWKDVLVDSQLALITANHNFQLDEALEFVAAMKKKYNLSEANLTLTGHSLGGILSQGIGSKLKIPAFAFNPMGTSKLELNNGSSYLPNILVKVLARLSIEKEIDEDWVNKNIITISYNDVGEYNGDVLSNIVTHLNLSKHIGIKIDIFGEDVYIAEGHSIITLNKLLETQSEHELTTVEDIKNYNRTQKTLFANLLIPNKIGILIATVNDKKCLLSVQTSKTLQSMIEPSTKTLIESLNHENVDSFMINAKIQRAEDKDNFDKKLYYSYEKNRLKLKTEDFKEAVSIVSLISKENQKLKKHNIILELQGAN